MCTYGIKCDPTHNNRVHSTAAVLQSARGTLPPINPTYRCDERNIPRCYASFVFHQRNLAMQTAEIVRDVTGRAVSIQMEQQQKGANRTRKYQVGDRVLLFSPPNERDTLHSQPWTGPHEIIEVANDLVVKLKLFPRERPIRTRGRRPKPEKWVHTNNVKPFVTSNEHILAVVDPCTSPDSLCSEKAARRRRQLFFEYWKVNY